MGNLTYNFEEALQFQSFAAAAKRAEKWLGGGGWFDGQRLEFQHHGDHWIIKLTEGHFTPRYFAS